MRICTNLRTKNMARDGSYTPMDRNTRENLSTTNLCLMIVVQSRDDIQLKVVSLSMERAWSPRNPTIAEGLQHRHHTLQKDMINWKELYNMREVVLL